MCGGRCWYLRFRRYRLVTLVLRRRRLHPARSYTHEVEDKSSAQRAPCRENRPYLYRHARVFIAIGVLLAGRRSHQRER